MININNIKGFFECSGLFEDILKLIPCFNHNKDNIRYGLNKLSIEKDSENIYAINQINPNSAFIYNKIFVHYSKILLKKENNLFKMIIILLDDMDMNDLCNIMEFSSINYYAFLYNTKMDTISLSVKSNKYSLTKISNTRNYFLKYYDIKDDNDQIINILKYLEKDLHRLLKHEMRILKDIDYIPFEHKVSLLYH